MTRHRRSPAARKHNGKRLPSWATAVKGGTWEQYLAFLKGLYDPFDEGDRGESVTLRKTPRRE